MSEKPKDGTTDAPVTDATVSTPEVQVPEKVQRAEDAALAAEISAAHVEVAVAQAEAAGVAAQKAADNATPPCPHCGRKLKPEHDLGDHLHCDGPLCIECCFDPGDPPTIRPNSPRCPSAR